MKYSIADIIVEAKRQFGGNDEGTCVMGMELWLNGTLLASQIAQGSVTNERYFNYIISASCAMIPGLDRDDFKIKWGWTD